MRNSSLRTFALAALFAAGSFLEASAQLTPVQLGGNRIGSVTDNGGGSWTIVGGGNDIWDQADEFTYAYAEITGDFDVQVRVESFTPTARWSKAGIMARESLSEFSRMVFPRVTPADVPTSSGGNGANDVVLAYRTGLFNVAGLSGGQHEDRDGANPLPNPNYPNAWLRLVRIGSVFYASNSLDGVAWNYVSSQDTAGWLGGAFKNTICLGLAAARHSGNPTATVEFRDLAFAPVSSAPFQVIGGSSRGQNNYVWVEFNKKPGAGTTTAGNYAIDGGVTVSAVTLNGINPSLVRLTTSTLTEGTTYNLTVSGVTADDGGPLTSGTASFVAGAGYEARAVMVTHSHTDNGGLYRDSRAVALGLGELLPLGGGTFQGVEGNTVFEDPIPDADNNEQFSSRVSGVLNVTTTGNYKFAMSSDDVGALYLSTDDNPANKVQIANEPAWNGRREYAAGGNQGTRGSPPSNISSAKALTAGQKYYLEVVFTEGGGGNNGSATWDGGTGAAFANGQSPIPAANMASARQFNGSVFYTLGPVFITQNPSDTTVPAGTGYGFSAKCDGTPGWALQWYKNGAAIPGGTNFSYGSTAVFPTDNGAQFYFVVTGPVNSATSSVATLTVTADLVPPTLLSVWVGLGNTNVFLRFSELMNPASANVAANYSIPGLTVLSATVFDGGSNVVLHTSAQTPGATYTLTVGNVTDFGAPALNPIDPNPTMVNFTAGAALLCQPGVIEREYYLGNVGGNVLQTLFNNPKWPANPDTLDLLNNTIGASGVGDNYGLRYAGHIIPPVSGNYFFEMHQDDSGRLRGSPDENANNAVTLINIDGSCCGFYPVGPIPLLAGKAYYFDAIMQEGGGGDYLELRWRPPGAGTFVPIPSANLAYCYNLAITTPPASLTLTNHRTATFTVGTATAGAAQAVGKLRYLWERSDDGGGTWNPIGGASGPSYSLANATTNDNGAQFRATVSVASNLLAVTSAAATLMVLSDTNPPVLVSANGNSTLDGVTVVFDELIDSGTATDPFNYTIPGLGIIGNPVLNPDGRSVTLTTAAQTENTLYTVEVGGVTDLDGNAMPDMPPGSITFRSYVTGCSGVLMEAYDTSSTGGNAVSLLTGHPNFPNNPRDRYLLTAFDSRGGYPDDSHEQYGGRMRGLFTPAMSGNYIFYLRSDDASQLFLNTSGPSAAGKTMVQEETGCCGAFAGHPTAAFPMTAGQGYYIEALWKEGGGGDYCQVAVKLSTDGTDPNTLAPIPAGLLGSPAAPPGVGGPVNITTQPADVTAPEGDSTAFTVVASNPNGLPLCYQWQRKNTGDPGFADVPGATGASLTVSPLTLPTDQGAQFRCIVSVIGSRVTSDAATLTVVPDTTPPALLSVGSLLGAEIGVCFNELLNQTTAEDPFNYTVNGGAVTVSGAALRSNGKQVVLTVTGLSSAAGTPFTVGVTGVTDRAFTPNAVRAAASNQVVGLLSADIGNPGDPQPPPPLPVIACSIEVTTGGSDIWDTHDGFHFDYAPKTGNFDVRVRVESLVAANIWSKAGLMARENLTPGSRNLNAIVDPPPVPALDGSGNGANTYEANYRDVQDGGPNPWPGVVSGAAPAYPNAWIRMVRAGNVFTAYRGTDGQNWTQLAQTTQTYPPTINVGLATTSHSLSFLTTAIYQDFFFVPPPSIQIQPASQTVSCLPVTFSVGATGVTALTYQWRRNGADLPGETNATLTVNRVPAPTGNSFDVVVSNTGGSTTSDPATITGLNAVAPVIGSCPSPMTLKSTNPAGAVVTFTPPTATDDCDANPVVACVPASGSLFPMGLSVVTCTATDSVGLTNACTFTVTMFPRMIANFAVGVDVPDASAVGLASTKTVSSPIAAITDLNVTLTTSNGWNGDLYAYLVHSDPYHPTGFSVLLNRVGKRLGDPLGYGDSGIDVTLDDTAANGDIHVYRFTLFADHNTPLGGPLTGSWAPDGRETDPALTDIPDARSALLSSFNGMDPNGEWVLYIADVEGGDVATLVSWGLDICGTLPVPPAFATQPTNFVAECGSGSATFNVGVTGTPPISIQWRFNGADIPGANAAALTINNVTPANAGNYDAVATNFQGGVTSVVATLTVVDTTAPVIITCASNRVLNTTATNCLAYLTDLTPSVTATDACSTVTITQDPAVGTSAAIGMHTVTLTVWDTSGNSNSCTATVTVEDHTPPSIACPADRSVPADVGTCFATGVALGTPTASDNCALDTVVSNAPASFPVGMTFVVWTATDIYGNANSCTQKVTVVEPIAPVIVCPPDLTLSCTDSLSPSNTGFATATDNCDPNPVLTWIDTPGVTVTSGNLAGWALYLAGAPLTAMADLAAGAGTPPIGSGSFHVAIGANGENAAEIRHSGYHNVRLTDLSELGYSTYRTTDGAGGEQAMHLVLNIDTDGNGFADDVICFEPRNQDGDNPSLPNQGATQTGTWQRWDALRGGWWSFNNPAVMTRGSGVRTLAYYASVFPNARIVNGPSGGGVRVGAGSSAGVYDNFEGNADRVVIGTNCNSTVYNFERDLRNPCLPLITRVWKATDNSGNMACCAQVLDVQDTMAPAITCPANIVTNITVGCTTPVSYAPIVTDNCANVTTNCDPASGSTFALGATTVNCSAVDACGNSNGCSFTVTVNAAAPAITAQPQNQTTPMGNGAVFSVTATGTATLLYQWQANGADISGATGASLAVSNVTLADSGTMYRVIIANCAGSVTSLVAVLTVTPIVGISFDWDSPGQFTNTSYNVQFNDWLHNPLPNVYFERTFGGANNSGVLDLLNASGTDATMICAPVSYDFSLNGKRLVASTLVRIKSPTAAGRNTQLGFVTATNVYSGTAPGLTAVGVNDNNPQGFMTAILEATTANALTYELRFQHRRTDGGIAEVTAPVGRAPAAAQTLVAGNWYKLTAIFVNTVGTTPNTFTVEASLQDMGANGATPGAVVQSFPVNNVTNTSLPAQKNMFLAVRMTAETRGVDLRDTTYAHATSGNVFFVAPPASQTVPQGRRAIFQALVDGDGPYTYQWNKDGSPIAGARNWKYTTPPTLLSDHGAQYTVTVTGPNNSLTSDPANLTVQPDPLAVVSVGSVDGCVVGVRFNQPVDPATAGNPANYLINGAPATGARVYVSNIGLNGPDGISVLLEPSVILSGAFSVTVQNVQDLSGGVVGANNSANGAVEGLVGLNVNPLVAEPTGQNYSFAPGQFEISGGGVDIFSAPDSFRYVYGRRTGDFDVKVKVPYQDVVRAPGKAGFDVRVSLDPTCPHVLASVNPMWPARGLYEGTFRQVYNVGGTSWGNGGTRVAYPNGWLRLRRAGNTFLRYSSANGVDWTLEGQVSPTPALPATVFLGFAVCSVANGVPATAQFESYGDFGGYPGAVISITQQPVGSATVTAGGSTNLSVTATISGAPASGEMAFLWQRSDGVGGFTNVATAGATNAVFNTGALFALDNGAQYRVIVSAPGAASVVSTVTTVTVTDAAAPTVTAAGAPNGATAQILITYSEPMGASAVNAANYVVTNAAGANMGVASAAFLHGDPRLVLLTTMNALAGGNYGVRISGVQDLGGNAINPDPTVRTFTQPGTSAPQLGSIVVEFYAGLTNGGATVHIGDLTNRVIGGAPGQKFANDTPDLTFYTNVFGINPGVAAFPATLDHYGVQMYSYFVAPTNGAYKFYVRADDYAQFLMNTNSANSTNPAGAVLQVQLTANNPNYTAANSVTNTLVGGQRYYMELRFKENTGGDGVAVQVRNDNTLPAATEVAPGSLFAFPDAVAKPTPAVVELYLGQVTLNPLNLNDIGAAMANGGYADLIAATNTPAFIARNPNVIGYARYFGYNTNLGQINATFDNYLGRIYANFAAPSNGLYKFYIRNDDSAELWMNTNALNSTDPAGMALLGLVNDFYDGNYRLVAQNVALTGGQRYYMEGRWRDGTGGDGMTVAVRSQSDFTIPGATEVFPGSLLEFPANFDRVGAVDVAISPVNPVVNEGETIVFQALAIRGTPTYGFFWLKNGAQIAANAVNFVTQPMTASDNGAVFTLVVTNGFSRVERSTTVTVIADGTPPMLVSAVGSQYQDFVVLTFSEPLDSATGGCLANYLIDNGGQVLSATLDTITRRRVTLRTTPQTPGTRYTVTVNGVRDATAGNVIAPNSTIQFTAWIAAGCGFYVEIFTNIAGTAVANLLSDPKHQNNWADVAYYTNRFGAGFFGNDSGLNNYGVRVSGLFTPPSNGLYRFYIRNDDGAQLYMNTNGSLASGRVLIARNDGANSGAFDNGVDNNTGLAASGSPILALNRGALYFMEALMKEGGGGDHVEVAMRPIDAGTLTPIGGLPAVSVNELLAGGFFVNVGNPDTARLNVTRTPPADLDIVENDLVTLRGFGHAPNFELSQATCYQWQKYDGSGGFTNVFAAVGPTYSFYARPADDGQQYRLIICGPGTNAVSATTMHVAPDATAPYLVSISSLNGTNIDLCFNEPVEEGSGTDPFNYSVNAGVIGLLGNPVQHTNDRRQITLTLDQPLPGNLPFTVEAFGMSDVAAVPNTTAFTTTNGGIQGFIPLDVGAPVAAGASFSCQPGEIDVVAGGNDIWGTSDVGHLTLSQRTGNFDIRVRVQGLTRPDAIAKAGLMVRESLNADSRMLYCDVNPAQYQVAYGDNPLGLPGRDLGEAGQRFATLNATAAWAARPESQAPIQVAGASAYLPGAVPNAWIRIKRVGNLFTAMRSYDGVNWLTYAQCPFNYADTVYVGLATTAHTAAQAAGLITLAEYRDIYIPPPPIILVQPVSQAVPRFASVTFSVVASNPPPNISPLTYQWSRNGVAIPGATGDILNIPSAMSGDTGTYTVRVCNDGGNVTSIPATLTVGSPPVANTDALCATQNMAISFSTADLLANDTDADNDPLSLVAVSGVYPATYAADFNGGVPAGLSIFGTTAHDAGVGALLINPSANSAAGAAVVDELTPDRRVTAFSASLRLRVFDGTGEPADGFSVNFAADVPLSASTAFGENGAGSGFSFCVDNYRFLPYPQGGLANTSGLKIRYRGFEIAGVRIPTWNSPRFVPISINVTVEGQCTVMVDGTNVFGAVMLPNYIPTRGRFGIYGRCGGQFESHTVDDLSLAVLTIDTTRPVPPINLGGASVYGNAYVVNTTGVGNSGALHVTDNVNGQAGSFILPDLLPGRDTRSFTASFGLRIGSGTGNAADGFSFNLASDLPNAGNVTAPVAGAAEEGATATGLAICIDNYPTGGADSPSFKLKWAGALIVPPILMPKWSSVNYIPVNITLDSSGALTVNVDGSNVVAGLVTPYAPISGARFGMYARTGGENETHWVDNLSISATASDATGASYASSFDNLVPIYGTVVLNSGVITYTPPTGVCGPDTFYYLITDGPQGSTSIGRVDVVIKEANPAPPVIVSCVTNQTLAMTGTNCLSLPDLTGGVITTDNCCCVTVTQDPPPGTILHAGPTVVTFTVTDTAGFVVTCQATITAIDLTPPEITCSTNVMVECTNRLGTVAEYSAMATDNCDVTVVCVPASGSEFLPGPTLVTCTATDTGTNTAMCSFSVIVVDTTPPTITCNSNRMVECASPAGTAVTYGASATDICDANPMVACLPPSGSLFPHGATTVTCMATDSSTNSSTCTFTVTVVDTIAPVITCPSNITAECSSPTGTPVTFAATATDVCTTNLTIVCAPSSGSSFAPGATTVTCQADDGHGNTNACSFTVTVRDTTAPTVCGGTNQFVYTAGTIDNFVGIEPSSPSAALQVLLQGLAFKQFDQPSFDTYLAHSFVNLPENISSAKLTLHLRGFEGFPQDDTITLGFAVDLPDGSVTLRPERWNRRIGSFDQPGLVPFWFLDSEEVFVLDLARLPNVSGPPTDLLPTLNRLRQLDLYIQDDTTVDYASLDIQVCACRPAIEVVKNPNDCGAVVTFATPVFTDNCDAAIANVTCSPPSGSFFQVGNTVVHCTATDSQGNKGLCSFDVTVVDPRPVNLTIMRNGNLVMISWDATCTADVLETTTSLGLPLPIVWTNVGVPIQTVGNMRKVTLSLSPGNHYFRVRRQ